MLGILLVFFCSLGTCMYCYAKPTRKRRFFKRLFKRRGDFTSVDNEPLLVLDDEPVTESKEGYFV